MITLPVDHRCHTVTSAAAMVHCVVFVVVPGGQNTPAGHVAGDAVIVGQEKPQVHGVGATTAVVGQLKPVGHDRHVNDDALL
jgi:hypothetical protein